ncbi:MAG: VCBS domain-containing protein, partial [Chlorobium sp.]|nr:VCBS domain-containing protein [Chlorobium sp.]
APTATNLTPTPATYTEGDASVALTDIVVTDADASDTITAVLVLNTPAAGSLTHGAFGSAMSTYASSTGIWTVTGSVADVNLALAAVSFTPATNNDLSTTITTIIRDASGTGPAPGTITLNVTPVNNTAGGINHAPTVSSGNLSQTIPYTEGASSVALGDIVVADVDAGDTITAVLTLNTPLAGVLTISGAATYSTATGIWTVTDTLDAVNAALAAVSFIPSAHWESDATITTIIRDAAGTGPAPGTMTLDVTPVNSAPTSTIDSILTNVSSERVLTLDDFGTFADPDAGNTFQSVKITQLESVGSLKYTTDGTNWLDVTPNQEISAAAITAGHLKYVSPQTTAAQVAAAVVAAGATTSYTVAIDPDHADTVVYTAIVSGDITDSNYLGAGNVLAGLTGNYIGITTVTQLANVVMPGIKEHVSAYFTPTLPSNSAVLFDGINTPLYTTDTWEVAAERFASRINTYSLVWTATISTIYGDEILFTAKADGNITPDITNGSFVFEYPDGSGVNVLAYDYVQGTTGSSYESFSVKYSEGTAGSTLIFDGVSATTGTAGGVGYDSITFKVGDGTLFSDNSYRLSVDGPGTTVTLAASSLTTEAANTWANAYNAAPLAGSSLAGTVHVALDASNGTIKLTAVTGLTNITGLMDGTATSISFDGTPTAVNAALQALQINRGANPEATIVVSAISGTEQVSRTFTVTGTVNYAPTATNLTPTPATYTEGDASVALTDIVVTDADASDTITAVLVLNTPAAGSLTHGAFGSAMSTYASSTGIWTVTGSVADVNLALAAVSFTPATNNDLSTTITTIIRDAAGAGPAPGTITLNVTPVNDAPTSANNSITTSKDITCVLTLSDFGAYADLEGSAISKVKITTLESAGLLEYNTTGMTWVAVTSDQEISATDITSGKLRFVPDAGAIGSATIGFKVSDGTDYSASAYTLTVNVTALVALTASNYAPTGSASASLTAGTEDTAYTVSAANLLAGFTDADSGDTLAVAGLSADYGSVVNNGDGTYTITPTANYQGAVSLTYSVTDGHGGNVAASQSFTLNSVNDAPALTAAQTALAGTEDVASVIAASSLLEGFTDIESTPTIKGNTVTASNGAIVVYNAGTGYTLTPYADYNGPVTLTYTVTDGSNDVVVTRVINFAAAIDVPTIGNAQIDQTATQEQLFSYVVPANTFSDDDLGDTLAYSAKLVTSSDAPVGDGTLPSWLQFDTQTREFLGTPDNNAVGTIYVRVTATDSTSNTVSDVIALTVANINDAPVVASSTMGDVLYSGTGSLNINLTGLFSDPDVTRGLYVTSASTGLSVLDALTYAVTLADGSSLPSWLSFNAGTKILSGQPPVDAPFLNLNVTATDAAGATANSTFTLSLGTLANSAGVVTISGATGAGSQPMENNTLSAALADSNVLNVANVTKIYQWQTSSDNGTTWNDIPGSRGQAATISLTQAEVGQSMRVWVFYQDDLGFAESPASSTTAPVVGNVDQPGTVIIDESVGLIEGATFTTTVADTDGLEGVTITYQWQNCITSNGTFANIAGATNYYYRSTSSDGGKFLRVVATYNDNKSTHETPVDTTSGPIQIGARAPVAANDAAIAVEAGFNGSAVAVDSNAVGNVITGTGTDTDGNDGDHLVIQSVRTGNTEGLGTPGELSGSTFTVVGTYGSLIINTDGGYTYTLDNANADVQAIKLGSTPLTETFNYTLKDDTNLTDRAVLTISITGSNDKPVAVGHTGSATEKGGIANAVDGENATGNVLTGTTDVDAGESFTVSAYRAGTESDSGTAASSVGAVLSGQYGTLTIASDGIYTYAVTEGNSAVQLLQTGTTLTDTFTFTVSDGHGGTDPAELAITIHGQNDAPVAASFTFTGVTEDQGQVTTGTPLSGTDVDNTNPTTFALVSGAAPGAFIFNTNGTWSYAPGTLFQELSVGTHQDLTFTYVATDSNGLSSAPATVTIQIDGANDNPIVRTNLLYQQANEDVVFTYDIPVSGPDRTFDDIDTLDQLQFHATLSEVNEDTQDYVALPSWLHFTTGSTVEEVTGRTITTAAFTGTPSNDVFAATDGGIVDYSTESKAYYIRVEATDGRTGTVPVYDFFRLTVHNINDAPQITSVTADAWRTAIESGSTDAGAVVAGTGVVTGTLSSSDADVTIDLLTTATWSIADELPSVTYGSIAIDSATGIWTYTLNNDLAATQALKEGEVVTQIYTARVTDNHGLYADQTITVTINGTNDVPVVANASAALLGSVTETGNVDDGTVVTGTASATGTLGASDVDDPHTHTWSIADASPSTTYGTMAIVPGTGVWTYTLDNTLAATRALVEGQVFDLTYTARVTDEFGASVDQSITVTIHGTNDVPVVTSLDSALLGTVTEAGNLDVGTVVDGTVTATGTLTASDEDAGATKTWSLQGAQSVTYGTMAIVSGTGVWTYTLNNTLAATQALKEGEQVTQSYTARVTDDFGASVDKSIVVTIDGTNDRPVVTNTSDALSGSVTEAGNEDNGTVVAGTASAIGSLGSSDVDAGYTHTWSIADALPSTTYGTMAIVSDTGVWTYTLNNALDATKALKESDVVTQTYIARVTDDFGATVDQTITVTIHGTNDVPVVTSLDAALLGMVIEAGNLDAGAVVAGTVTATGTLTASDEDAAHTLTWSLADASPSATYGSMAITSSGVWTYTLNNTLEATQLLKEGEHVTQSYMARVTDDFGAYVDKSIVVTIDGTNDVPVVTNAVEAVAGTVTEAGNEDNGTVVAGIAIVTGTLTASDADANHTQAWSIQGTPSATYGTMAIDASSGVWTYTLNNTLDATQALKEGETVTQTYTARVTDDFGAYVDQTVTITIHGTNDIPTAGAVTGVTTLTEDVVGSTFTIDTPFSDVDHNAVLTYTARLLVNGVQQNLPTWLTLFTPTYNDATIIGDDRLTFTGTPRNSNVGAYTIRLTATDDKSATFIKDFILTVANVNDAPTCTITIPDQTTDQGQLFTYHVPDGTFTDIDITNGSGDDLTWSALNADGRPLPGWLSFNATTHIFTGSPIADSTIEASDVRVVVTDIAGSSIFDIFKISVNNVNDLPLPTDAALPIVNITGAAGGTLTAVTSNLSDNDGLGTLHYQWQISSDNGATWSDAGTGLTTYTAPSAAELVRLNVSYTDLRSGSNMVSSTFIPETNAALSTSGTLTIPSMVTALVDSVSLGGNSNLSDLSASTALQLKGMLSIPGVADTTLNWSFASGTQLFNYLADGETLILNYRIKAFATGGVFIDTAVEVVSIIITGTNDTPTITVVDVTGAVTEETPSGDPLRLRESGSMTFTDSDTTDTSDATSTFVNATTTGPSVPGALTSGLEGALSLSGDILHAHAGTIGWSFALDNSLVQYLAADETVTATYSITLTDDSGTANATTTQDVTVTIHGTNDVPVITAEDLVGGVTELTTTPGA